MKTSLYAVEIIDGYGNRVISRYFATIRAARNWAKWTAKKWETRILKGGMGGEEIP